MSKSLNPGLSSVLLTDEREKIRKKIEFQKKTLGSLQQKQREAWSAERDFERLVTIKLMEIHNSLKKLTSNAQDPTWAESVKRHVTDVTRTVTATTVGYGVGLLASALMSKKEKATEGGIAIAIPTALLMLWKIKNEHEAIEKAKGFLALVHESDEKEAEQRMQEIAKGLSARFKLVIQRLSAGQSGTEYLANFFSTAIARDIPGKRKLLLATKSPQKIVRIAVEAAIPLNEKDSLYYGAFFKKNLKNIDGGDWPIRWVLLELPILVEDKKKYYVRAGCEYRLEFPYQIITSQEDYDIVLISIKDTREINKILEKDKQLQGRIVLFKKDKEFFVLEFVKEIWQSVKGLNVDKFVELKFTEDKPSTVSYDEIPKAVCKEISSKRICNLEIRPVHYIDAPTKNLPVLTGYRSIDRQVQEAEYIYRILEKEFLEINNRNYDIESCESKNNPSSFIFSKTKQEETVMSKLDKDGRNTSDPKEQKKANEVQKIPQQLETVMDIKEKSPQIDNQLVQQKLHKRKNKRSVKFASTGMIAGGSGGAALGIGAGTLLASPSCELTTLTLLKYIAGGGAIGCGIGIVAGAATGKLVADYTYGSILANEEKEVRDELEAKWRLENRLEDTTNKLEEITAGFQIQLSEFKKQISQMKEEKTKLPVSKSGDVEIESKQFEDYKDVELVQDQNSLFWAVALSTLFPICIDDKTFNQVFKRLFGTSGCVKEKEPDGELLAIGKPETREKVRKIFLTYDGQKAIPKAFENSCLEILVCRIFRKRVVEKMEEALDDDIQEKIAKEAGKSDWSEYTEYMRKSGLGSKHEIKAMSDLAQVNIHVHAQDHVYDYPVGDVKQIAYLVEKDSESKGKNQGYHFRLPKNIYQQIFSRSPKTITSSSTPITKKAFEKSLEEFQKTFDTQDKFLDQYLEENPSDRQIAITCAKQLRDQYSRLKNDLERLKEVPQEIKEIEYKACEQALAVAAANLEKIEVSYAKINPPPVNSTPRSVAELSRSPGVKSPLHSSASSSLTSGIAGTNNASSSSSSSNTTTTVLTRNPFG